MKKYSIEEIKRYILKQDSLGDVMYNLNEKNLDAAQEGIKIYDLWSGDVKIRLNPNITMDDEELIKEEIIQYMDEQGMERSGYEEITPLKEILESLEYDIEE